MKKACDFSKGPFFSNLDISLQKLNVKRQAYQGGTFIGNHVHKLLKVKKKTLPRSKLPHYLLLLVSQHHHSVQHHQASSHATPVSSSSGQQGC